MLKSWSLYPLFLLSTNSFQFHPSIFRSRFSLSNHHLLHSKMMSTNIHHDIADSIVGSKQHDIKISKNQGNDITVMTYNMLEQALSFGAIPWVMIIPQYLKDQCENFDHVQLLLTKEYQKHWHKNKNAGDYKRFRILFGENVSVSFSKSNSKLIDEKQQEEGGQESILVPGSSLIKYGLPSVKYIDDHMVEVNGQCCVTLYGILLKHLIAKSSETSTSNASIALSNEIFDYLVKANEEVFSWQVRGPRIFNLITNGGGNLAHQFVSPSQNSVNKQGDEGEGASMNSDGSVCGLVRSKEDSLLLDRFFGPISPLISTSECDPNARKEAIGENQCDDETTPSSSSSTAGDTSAPSLVVCDFSLPPGVGPDIIILQEYDAHEISETCPALNYFGGSSSSSSSSSSVAEDHTRKKCSFSDAMCLAGYHSLLFDGPKRDGTGIGIFAKASKFTIPSSSSSSAFITVADAHASLSQDSNEPVSQVTTTTSKMTPTSTTTSRGDAVIKGSICVDEWLPGMSYGSFDFKELYHPMKSMKQDLEAIPVPMGDRKHFGALMLDVIDQVGHVSRASGGAGSGGSDDVGSSGVSAGDSVKRLVVIGTHLMTTSRDCKGKVVYPGQIRAHELSTLKTFASSFVTSSEDSVILAGDFNINMRMNDKRTQECLSEKEQEEFIRKNELEKNNKPKNEKFVFEGIIPKQVMRTNSAADGFETSPNVLCFDTGYITRKDIATTAAGDGDGADNDDGDTLIHKRSMFCWKRQDNGSLILYDSYEGYNQLPEDLKTGQTLGSSHNAARIDTIDYIWYDSSHLLLKSRSALITPMPDGTPDRANPSDHIPLLAAFEFI